MIETPRPPEDRNATKQSDEVQSDEENARAEADVQIKEQVEDQEGPRLGDLGSLEE